MFHKLPKFLEFNDGSLIIRDVSGRDKIPMKKLVHVRDVEQYKKLELEAILNEEPISFSGRHHSMGGQTMVHNGIQVNTTKYFNEILDFDKVNNTVTVQPGITWDKLIRFLNEHKKSPAVLQSYSTFSVGGSAGVNAHGITSDHCLADTVVELELISNGKFYKCSREENPELFAGVMGGYGLLGFITSIKLKVTDNHKLQMTNQRMNIDQFIDQYMILINDPEVRIKYARVDTVHFDKVTQLVYRKTPGEEAIESDLPDEPRQISWTSQLIFKWLFAKRFGKEIRGIVEWMKGGSVDTLNTTNMGPNDIVYENANTITEIWEPLIQVNKTHILHEYFIPIDRLKDFIEKVKALLGTDNSLLNLTIRFVKKDETTILNYAKEDYCALVFYYRIDNTDEGEANLKRISRHLVATAIQMGGTFYLPYRPDYDESNIRECYHMDEFIKLKKRYDPTNTYRNIWFDKYFKMEPTTEEVNDEHVYSKLSPDPNNIEREASYYQDIFQSASDEDIKTFADYVFTLAPADSLIKSVRTTRPDMVYSAMADMHISMKPLKQISLLRSTQAEIGSELLVLLQNQGYNKTTEINGVVMVGDPGRYMHIMKNFNVVGNKYIMTESQGMTDSIETGSLFAAGEFIPIDYHNFEDTLQIPSNSIDLMFVPVGFHHFSPEDQDKFMQFANRIIRPTGKIIIREHDAQTERIRNMAHVAHTVFNALTGVSQEDDNKEIRDFKSIHEWETFISKYGFNPDHVHEMDPLDPTVDIMFSLTKKGTKPPKHTPSPHSEVFYSIPEWKIVDETQRQGAFMEHTPFFEYPYLAALFSYWIVVFQTISADRRRSGTLNAIFNEGTLMTICTGTLITLQHIFMAVVSTPIRWFSRSDWGKARVVCDVTVQCNTDMKQLKAKLIELSCVIIGEDDEQQLVYIHSPRYKKMIEVFREIAFRGDQVINAGSMPELTVKYSFKDKIDIDYFGMEVVTSYTYYDNKDVMIIYSVPTSRVTELLAKHPNVQHIWG